MKDYEIGASVVETKQLSAKEIEDKLLEALKATFNIEERIENIQQAVSDLLKEECDVCKILEYIDKIKNIISEITGIGDDLVNGISKILTEATAAVNKAIEAAKEKAQEAINKGIEAAKDKVSEGKDAAKNTVDSETSGTEDANAALDKDAQIPSGLEDFNAFGIIMKRFQILKLRIKRIILVLKRLVALTCRDTLIWVLSGAGSTMTAPINSVLSALSAVGAAAQTVLTALGLLLMIIQPILDIFGIEGGGMSFFMTPKSLITAPGLAVRISQINAGITTQIPEPVQKVADNAVLAVKQAYSKTKFAKIAAIATQGAAAAASDAGFSVPSFGPAEAFDPNNIKKVIHMAIEVLLMAYAEPLPRYEKLTPVNVRFMMHLALAWEPTAKKCFGIPGFP